MVFCHEWVQIRNGTVCALPLSADLKEAAGEPVELFAAADAAWVEPVKNGAGYVTDGPFMYRGAGGELLLLWSSFMGGKYAQAIARSESGTIAGPWRHEPGPLFAHDGGHGMIFRTFDGRIMLALHSPNRTPDERPVFFELAEEEGRLRIAGR